MIGIQFAIKRSLDILLCAGILMAGIPILVSLAVAVKLSSPGPIMFIQRRAGKHGRPFKIYKFRTMRQPEEDYQQAMVWTKTDEERITCVGAFLRDYGLDELPQLLNILRGQMSIVGPRPLLVDQTELLRGNQKKYLNMRPGVVTYSSIHGRRSLTFEQKVALNVWYVEHWSLWLDLKILFQALFVVILRKNARFSPPQEV